MGSPNNNNTKRPREPSQILINPSTPKVVKINYGNIPDLNCFMKYMDDRLAQQTDYILSQLGGKIDDIKRDMDAVVQRVVKLEESCKDLLELRSELNQLKSEFQKQENFKISSD